MGGGDQGRDIDCGMFDRRRVRSWRLGVLMQFSKNMRNAPKDGRLILIDTFPEAQQPVAAFWSGKWWRSPAGGWVNHGKRWMAFPVESNEAK